MIDVQYQIAAIKEAIQRGRAGERAHLIKVCAKYEIDKTTLMRWMAKVENKPHSEWPAALRGRYKGRQKFADLTLEAWEYFVSQYRLSRSLQEAYKGCVELAKQKGWAVPSERTLHRKIKRHGLLLPRRDPYPTFDV